MNVPVAFREIEGATGSFAWCRRLSHDAEHDLAVGRHLPPASERGAAFIARFHGA